MSGRTTNAQCPECARLDRSRSVAADTIADDPRPYSVYLAYFGPGLLKVGITAAERGSARLLEQGAVAFSWLGCGPLMAARRSEELLRAALGVPDRIPYAVKRAVRAELPSREERAAELAGLHGRAVALSGWPESLERAPFESVDHAEVFGIEGLGNGPGQWQGGAVVSELVSGGVVAGELLAVAGPDLYVGGLVLDSRLMAGWVLGVAGPGQASDVPVKEVVVDPVVQDGLF